MTRITYKYFLFLSLAVLFLSQVSFGQNGSQKHTGKRLQDFTDSLKSTEYPYKFPAWGDKVREKGFDIPLPHGIMVTSITSSQNILLQNMELGINGSQLVDVSDFVRFRNVEVNAQVSNFRFDTWILPFLNAYVLGGFIDSDTEVNVGLPIDLTANSSNSGPYYGFGVMLAGGFGPVWVSTDINFSWAQMELLDNATKARVNGIRIGHTWVSKKRPRQNIAFWVGGQYQKLGSQTSGSVDLREVLSPSDEQSEIIYNELVEWFEGLDPLRQEFLSPIFAGAGEFFQNRDSGTTIQYRFDKDIANPWTLAVGGQWQINEAWQFRTEYNFLGSRTQFMLSLNYRFGIKGPNFLSKDE